MNDITVLDIPGINARVAFTETSDSVFRETADCTLPSKIGPYEYIPWGADNLMPYNILELIERDETLSTCQMFNAEVCYGSGLVYKTDDCSSDVKDQVDVFLTHNSIPSYFLGCCQDFKHFAFCVSVIILNKEGDKIVRLIRKPAIYCRFSKARNGIIERVLFANWRQTNLAMDEVEDIELLDVERPYHDLMVRMGRCMGDDGEKKVRTKKRKFAILTKVPTVDNTYYPIPYYASLFRGKWYNIKRLIALAKETKLKNTAPLRYHIEINDRYWTELLEREKITDVKKQQERIIAEKHKMIDFITGVENSGKVLFSGVYVNPNGEPQSLVKITRIDIGKEGGDWESDIQEAVNMICFTMRVHSNLVGSVPGKAQTNNSGSDKRELYTIAQSLQKPYHDLLFIPHKLIIQYNNWTGVAPDVPFIQLTTLDENKDAQKVTTATN